MKQLLMLFIVLCAFCSCAKNYPQLVNERVAQYEKEGKWILCRSNDETGKEHFIVYADKNAQTICVDTVGDGVKTIVLKDLKCHGILPTPIMDADLTGASPSFSIFNDNLTSKCNWSVGTSAITVSYYGDKENISEVKPYKDKYIVLQSTNQTLILFLTKPQIVECDKGMGNVNESSNGDIELSLRYEDRLFFDSNIYDAQCTYRVVFDCNGDIKKQDDFVICDGVNIPTAAFGDNDAIKPYVQEVLIKAANRSFYGMD